MTSVELTNGRGTRAAARACGAALLAGLLAMAIAPGARLAAQSAAPASQAVSARPAIGTAVKPFVAVEAPVVVLRHVRLIDGTGQPAKDDQTIVIDGAQIRAVGRSADITPPAGAQVIDLPGHTVIPGLIGLHDHMYYSSPVGGSMRPMLFSYPRLFLANGVTTVRTTGSVDSYQELNLRAAIAKGETPGPEIHVTGPYLQGPGPGPAAMHPLKDADDARRMVRYWAQEGVTWFKAYTQLTRAELGAAIDEAHRNGIKVTAHLCSIGFREAVELGIDNLEHGLLTNTEFFPGKQVDACPTATEAEIYGPLDLASPAVKQTIDLMVARKVALTSTLAVMELSSDSRGVPEDPRVLAALHPDAAKAVSAWLEKARAKTDPESRANLKKAMRFEKMFADAGGLLAAGSDPCCVTVTAGYGDQRNFELLVEAGFTPEQAIQVMTANGARVLGIADRVGTIAAGRQADLVVLQGDPVKTPGDIRKVTTVFRQGIGYDPVKLTDAVRGLVGVR